MLGKVGIACLLVKVLLVESIIVSLFIQRSSSSILNCSLWKMIRLANLRVESEIEVELLNFVRVRKPLHCRNSTTPTTKVRIGSLDISLRVSFPRIHGCTWAHQSPLIASRATSPFLESQPVHQVLLMVSSSQLPRSPFRRRQLNHSLARPSPQKGSNTGEGERTTFVSLYGYCRLSQ